MKLEGDSHRAQESQGIFGRAWGPKALDPRIAMSGGIACSSQVPGVLWQVACGCAYVFGEAAHPVTRPASQQSKPEGTDGLSSLWAPGCRRAKSRIIAHVICALAQGEAQLV